MDEEEIRMTKAEIMLAAHMGRRLAQAERLRAKDEIYKKQLESGNSNMKQNTRSPDAIFKSFFNK